MRTAHPAGPALARALLLGMLAFPLVLSAQAAEPAPQQGLKVISTVMRRRRPQREGRAQKVMAIIEYRKEHGAFTIDEPAGVRGIALI